MILDKCIRSWCVFVLQKGCLFFFSQVMDTSAELFRECFQRFFAWIWVGRMDHGVCCWGHAMKPRNCPVTVPTRVVNLERYLEKKKRVGSCWDGWNYGSSWNQIGEAVVCQKSNGETFVAKVLEAAASVPSTPFAAGSGVGDQNSLKVPSDPWDVSDLSDHIFCIS